MWRISLCFSYDASSAGYCLWIRRTRKREDGYWDIDRLVPWDSCGVAEGFTWQSVKAGEYARPCFSLDAKDSQKLVDEILSTGVKPSSGIQSEGHLASIQGHLKDMRIIVSKTLGIDLCAS